MIRDPSWPPCFHSWYVLDCVAGARRGGRGEGRERGGEGRERGRGREKGRGGCAFTILRDADNLHVDIEAFLKSNVLMARL